MFEMTQSDIARSMMKPSRARILRIEISNPGLPESLTDLITSRRVDTYRREFLYRRRIFQDEHDRMVRSFLGVPTDARCTFEKYVLRYTELKRTYVRNILCYGNFTIKNHDLIIPHPHIAERDFAKKPLLEISKPEIREAFPELFE